MVGCFGLFCIYREATLQLTPQLCLSVSVVMDLSCLRGTVETASNSLFIHIIHLSESMQK